MDVAIETYEWNTFLGKVNPGLEGKADMAEDGLDDQRSRHAALPGAAHGGVADKGGFNSGYYSNPEVDELLNAARKSTDQAERAKLYQEMQTIVQEDAPWVFVANWKQNAVTRASGRELQAAAVLLPDAAEGRQAAIAAGATLENFRPPALPPAAVLNPRRG